MLELIRADGSAEDKSEIEEDMKQVDSMNKSAGLEVIYFLTELRGRADNLVIVFLSRSLSASLLPSWGRKCSTDTIKNVLKRDIVKYRSISLTSVLNQLY